MGQADRSLIEFRVRLVSWLIWQLEYIGRIKRNRWKIQIIKSVSVFFFLIILYLIVDIKYSIVRSTNITEYRIVNSANITKYVIVDSANVYLNNNYKLLIFFKTLFIYIIFSRIE